MAQRKWSKYLTAEQFAAVDLQARGDHRLTPVRAHPRKGTRGVRRHIRVMPEELTFTQSDDYDWPYSGESVEAARRVALQTGGTLYTQIAGDIGDDVYLRGEHLVNRTGRYVVMK